METSRSPGSASSQSSTPNVLGLKNATRRRSSRWSESDLAVLKKRSGAFGVATATRSQTVSARAAPTSGASKYGNKRVEIDGIPFDSVAEARRYQELQLLEKAGEIRDLRVHTSWAIKVQEIMICKYECDFEYWTADGDVVVEDVKGFRTREYRIKKRLMKALFGINIHEVNA